MRIINKRIKNENYVEISSTDFNSENDTLKAYQKYIPMKDKDIKIQETLYFSRFLYAENFIPIEDTDIGKANIRLVNKIGTDFSEKIVRELLQEINAINDSEILPQLMANINRINFRWIYFQYSTNTFITDNQWKYFEEVYPEYFEFVISFIEKAAFIKSESAKKTLFYDYLFAIITIVPISYLSRSINICIDFSRGKTYTDYISNNILQFQSMDINISTKPDDKTDLYISDYNSEFVSCNQIIWKEPPTNKDWKNFGNTLVFIRREKQREKAK